VVFGVPCLQQRINTTRLCEQIVSNQCPARQSAEACIAELVAASRGGVSASTAGSSRPVAVIAALAAAAGA
jgi:hypothetical protein